MVLKSLQPFSTIARANRPKKKGNVPIGGNLYIECIAHAILKQIIAISKKSKCYRVDIAHIFCVKVKIRELGTILKPEKNCRKNFRNSWLLLHKLHVSNSIVRKSNLENVY